MEKHFNSIDPTLKTFPISFLRASNATLTPRRWGTHVGAAMVVGGEGEWPGLLNTNST